MGSTFGPQICHRACFSQFGRTPPRHSPKLHIAMNTKPCSDLDVVSDESYEDAVISSSKKGKPVIVDFFTDWCGPCKLVEPVLRDLHASGAVKVVKAKPEDTERFRAWL